MSRASDDLPLVSCREPQDLCHRTKQDGRTVGRIDASEQPELTPVEAPQPPAAPVSEGIHGDDQGVGRPGRSGPRVADVMIHQLDRGPDPHPGQALAEQLSGQRGLRCHE